MVAERFRGKLAIMNPESIDGAGPEKDKAWESRAVTRPVEAGNIAVCAACDEPVKFAARNKAFQVIANVYEGGVWQRVETYHDECYEAAGEPYGSAS
jgi:hypothetical protein